MQKRHIMLAVPAYTGTVYLTTMRSVIADLISLMRADVLVTIEDETASALIGDARAEIVAKFLASKCTHLMFIDWDVCWQAGSILKLLNHDYDLCGGIYPNRQDPIAFTLPPGSEAELPVDQRTGCLEVNGLHGGFMLIKRETLETMVGHHQSLNFERKGRMLCGLFESYWRGTSKLGEDYAFCQRWRDLGGKVWLDPNIQMGHVGTKVFAGQFGEWRSMIDDMKDAAE
jgi:hypothetical protein